MRLRTRTVVALPFALAAFAACLLRLDPPLWAAESDAPPSVEIRHIPRETGQTWAVAESANFRIHHNLSWETADRAARVAETARAAAEKKWFGDAAPAWDEPCDIYLYADGRDYSLATQQPPQVAGHSSYDLRDGRVLKRRIDMHCDDPSAFVAILPHETTHVVLAGRFGDHRLPHWADEGMAVMSEPRERVELHLRNLPRHRREDELFPVAELMQMDDYPDGRRIAPFYAESVSLVSFLSSRKGPAAFAHFLSDGLDDGYESALKKDYGIEGFDDLQKRWQHYAFGG